MNAQKASTAHLFNCETCGAIWMDCQIESEENEEDTW